MPGFVLLFMFAIGVNFWSKFRCDNSQLIRSISLSRYDEADDLVFSDGITDTLSVSLMLCMTSCFSSASCVTVSYSDLFQQCRHYDRTFPGAESFPNSVAEFGWQAFRGRKFSF